MKITATRILNILLLFSFLMLGFFIESKLSLFKLNSSKTYSFFVIDGELDVNNKKISKGTFFIVDKESSLNFKAKTEAEIFEIKSPSSPSYKTYFQRFMN